MAPPIMTRSQRRLEKKQALVLLALVLGVSLVSFTLGVMVGKGSGGEAVVQASAPGRLPVSPPPGQVPADGAPAAANLTFYDTLPRGEQSPLGSGINLPPEPADRNTAAEIKPAPAVSAEAAPAVTPPAPTRPAAKESPAAPAKVPAAPAAGSWILQVASFQEEGDARQLQERLAGKGYAASIQKADLGAKGRWYRVMLGPFPGEEAARKTSDRLKTELNLSAMLRRS